MLINPYTPGVELKNFPTLNEEIASHYDVLYDTVPDTDFLSMTPRFKIENGLKIGFRDIFYYINLLYDNDPASVIDVGCGECVWKKWFPNITGFDTSVSKWSAADFVDHFDEDFSKGHTKNYDCGMAVNSLHFVDWQDIPKQIDLAMNMVKDRFLFTFNFSMINHKPELSGVALISKFNDLIGSLDYEIILADYPLMHGISESGPLNWGNWMNYSGINGHARFILAHKF
jgi:hypothetical protein